MTDFALPGLSLLGCFYITGPGTDNNTLAPQCTRHLHSEHLQLSVQYQYVLEHSSAHLGKDQIEYESQHCLKMRVGRCSQRNSSLCVKWWFLNQRSAYCHLLCQRV